MKKCNRERHGEYEIKFHPGGGFSVYGDGIRRRGYYVPSDSRIKERYEKEGETGGLRTLLQYRAIPHYGKKSLIKGREAVGLPPKIIDVVSRDEIIKAIKEFWPEEDVERYLSGEDVELKRIVDFEGKHRRQYHAAHRAKSHKEGGSFMGIMEDVYPELYGKLNRIIKADDINKEELGSILLSRFYSGLHLSRTALLTSGDRKEKRLLRQIEALADSGLFRKAGNYTKIVMKLTGLRKDDIIDSRIGKDNARLTEELTEMFFEWAFLAELELSDFIKKGEVYSSGEMVKFSYNKKEGRADLRIGNQAVEVKTGMGNFDSPRALDLIEKYATGKKLWYNEEPLDASLVIFHQRKELYEEMFLSIKNAGINIMSYEQFHSCLAELISLIKGDYKHEINEIEPRIHNLDYLVELHEEISLRPGVLMRKGNLDRREWSHKLLQSLAEKARQLQHNDKK